MIFSLPKSAAVPIQKSYLVKISKRTQHNFDLNTDYKAVLQTNKCFDLSNNYESQELK